VHCRPISTCALASRHMQSKSTINQWPLVPHTNICFLRGFASVSRSEANPKSAPIQRESTERQGDTIRIETSAMNPRGYRSNRTSLFDGIEEGGIRATSYSSHEIDEHENDRAIDGLQDRVSILKLLSGDIHEEVETHNRMLDRMGNDMDTSRGFLSGTVDKFKMVFETKSSRRMGTLVASFVALFLLVYYLTR